MGEWVSTTESTEDSWTSTHTVDLGDYNPADLLVLSIGFDGGGPAPGLGGVTGPAGWTEVLSIDVNQFQKWRVWLRDATGSEGATATVSTVARYRSAAQVIRFAGIRSGQVEGTAWDIAATASGYGLTVDPPTVSPSWGSAAQVYVALAFAAGNSPAVTAYPSGFSGTNYVTSRATVASASLEQTSTSNDPSAFTLSGSNNHRAATLVLRPAATVIAGAGVAAATAAALGATTLPPTVNVAAGAASASAAARQARPVEVPVASNVVVEWDLDGDSDYDQAVEDITDLVEFVTFRRGRNYASQVTGRATPAQCRMRVRNDGDQFNYFNTGSPLNTAPFSLQTGRRIRVRTSESTPTDPTELARDSFAGNGPVATADTGETWTTRTSAGWSEFDGAATADGPPAPGSSVTSVDPAALAWSPLDNSTAFTFALRPATGETPSVRSTSTLAPTGTAASHNMTLPASIEANDIIVLAIATQDSTTAPAAQVSGFTQADYHAAVGSFRPAITILYKVATGTEDSTTVSIGWGGGSYDTVAVAFAVDGVDTSTPFDVTPPAMVEGTSNPNPPGITPATGGSLIIAGANGNLPAGTPSATLPTDFTSVVSQAGQIKAFVVGQYLLPTGDGTPHIVTLDAGASTYYAQIIYPERDNKNQVGIVWYWTDTDNYGVAYVADGTLTLTEVVSGTATELDQVGVENRSDVAVGVETDGSTISVLVDGVLEISETTALTATSDVGLFGRWYGQRPPKVDEFRVWDSTLRAAPAGGLLGTFQVTRVVPTVAGDGNKVADIDAIGFLGQLERPISAPSSTGPDDVQSAGVGPGHIIGSTLHRVGALHPPGPIARGDVALGSLGRDRQRAISIARLAEDTELGFLYETRDGAIGFQDRSHRDGTPVVATFTDDVDVPGVGYETIRQLDWSGDVINRVRSEVSPSLPRQFFADEWAVTNTGVANDVDITIPAEGTGPSDAAVGDLLLVVAASTVQADGVTWLTPPGWTSLREHQDQLGIRVYAKRLSAGDFGDTVVFYDDTTNAGGGFILQRILVKNWFGVIDSGVAVTEFDGHGGASAQALAGDNDPPVMFTPWPIGPTLFLAFRAGIGSTSGHTFVTPTEDDAPAGFDSHGGFSVNGVANPQDVSLQWCRRIRTEAVVNPGPFGGTLTGFDLVETVVVAVRGFAGDPPPSSGGFGVTSDNTASQLARGAVLDHPAPGVLFEDQTAALEYNDLVLERYAADRPIVSMGFTATRSQQLREFAATVDLSDRIRIDADGPAGLGIDAEFFVEAVTHTLQSGTRLWQTVVECSPATDSGGGAD